MLSNCHPPTRTCFIDTRIRPDGTVLPSPVSDLQIQLTCVNDKCLWLLGKRVDPDGEQQHRQRL